MDRREAMRATLAAGARFALPLAADVYDYGEIRPPAMESYDVPLFRKTFALTGDAPRKNCLLYQHLQKEIGEIVPHRQPRITEGGEGDCVGHAAAMACDVLAATNIHLFRRRESFVAKSSVEAIYWGSRVEIGQNRLPFAGSHVVWAAKYLQRYGVLHRLPYRSGDDRIDLRGYDQHRSRERRNTGVPDWLEPIAMLYPVRAYTRIETGAQVLAALCAGQPVVIGSSYAFPNKRDKHGFTKPYLSQRTFFGWRRKRWQHAMVATGAILEGPKQGAVIQNSHGKWNSGPQPYDMPDGAFAVETKYLDLMVKDFRDAYALSAYTGYELNKVRSYLQK